MPPPGVVGSFIEIPIHRAQPRDCRRAASACMQERIESRLRPGGVSSRRTIDSRGALSARAARRASRKQMCMIWGDEESEDVSEGGVFVGGLWETEIFGSF